jgi:hypothetical protein
MPDDEEAISATVPRKATGKWTYPAYGETPRRTPRAEKRDPQTSAQAGKNQPATEPATPASPGEEGAEPSGE